MPTSRLKTKVRRLTIPGIPQSSLRPFSNAQIKRLSRREIVEKNGIAYRVDFQTLPGGKKRGRIQAQVLFNPRKPGW